MKIGPITAEKPICLAPMEDVTDAPFRIICKELGADIVYTEFTSCEAVIRHIPKALKKIQVYDEERPVAIQIFGGNESSMEGAAAIAESLKPDFIDVNCGCWVKDVVARNEGAGLLRDLPKFERIVKSVVRGTSLPVTVKTRLGWDKDSICILDVAKMVEQTGAKALTVHCRVRSQGHNGQADWDWLHKIKQVISIPLIGNGDLFSPEDIKRMFETGCDGVMVGRGAIGNPWIFKQAKHFMETGNLLPDVSAAERIDICLKHLKLNIEHHDEKFGVITFRKHYTGYLKGLPYASSVRQEIITMPTYQEVETRLRRYAEELSQHAFLPLAN